MAKKLIKRKNTQTDAYSRTMAENDQLELYKVKQQAKLLKKREDELKGRLDPYMQKSFTPDAKGHFMFTTVDAEGNKIHLQKQARKKISLNEERAKSYLVKNGLERAIINKQVVASEVTQDQIIEVLEQYAPHLLDIKDSVDEPTIELMLGDETIPMEDFEELCDINITYAMTYIDDKQLQKEVEDNAIKGIGKKV